MYTYPTENTTEQRVYSREGLPGEQTLLITDRKEQRITHSLYTADGSIRRKTVSVLGKQDRIFEEAESNAAGSVFRRLVHTYGSEEQRIATARYGAQDVFVGPVGKSEYVYSDQDQLSRSHDYGMTGYSYKSGSIETNRGTRPGAPSRTGWRSSAAPILNQDK